jgi:hypothetical protein
MRAPHRFQWRLVNRDGCHRERDMDSHSRGTSCPSLAKQCPSFEEGRRECRVFVAPAALRAGKKARKQVTTGTPKHSGIPCTTVYGL